MIIRTQEVINSSPILNLKIVPTKKKDAKENYVNKIMFTSDMSNLFDTYHKEKFLEILANSMRLGLYVYYRYKKRDGSIKDVKLGLLYITKGLGGNVTDYQIVTDLNTECWKALTKFKEEVLPYWERGRFRLLFSTQKSVFFNGLIIYDSKIYQ